jgi:hypothetical protein
MMSTAASKASNIAVVFANTCSFTSLADIVLLFMLDFVAGFRPCAT